MRNDDLPRLFNAWVDRVLIEHRDVTATAYNFNLYEHVDSFAVQLIGAASFESDDSSWACDEVFSSGEDLFEIPRALVGDDWTRGLDAAKSLVSGYLQNGAQAARLRSSRAVGLGFVDGDLELAHVGKGV